MEPQPWAAASNRERPDPPPVAIPLVGAPSALGVADALDGFELCTYTRTRLAVVKTSGASRTTAPTGMMSESTLRATDINP